MQDKIMKLTELVKNKRHKAIYFEGLLLPSSTLREILKMSEVLSVSSCINEEKSCLVMQHKRGAFEVNDLRYCYKMLMDSQDWTITEIFYSKGKNKGNLRLSVTFKKKSLEYRQNRCVLLNGRWGASDAFKENAKRKLAWAIVLRTK